MCADIFFILVLFNRYARHLVYGLLDKCLALQPSLYVILFELFKIQQVTHSNFILWPDSHESRLVQFGLRELRVSLDHTAIVTALFQKATVNILLV